MRSPASSPDTISTALRLAAPAWIGRRTALRFSLQDVWLALHWLWLPVFDETRKLESFRQLLHDSGMVAYTAAVVLHGNRDLGASIASGSHGCRGMAIVPCSMKTLAGVAHGLSRLIGVGIDLVDRHEAADRLAGRRGERLDIVRVVAHLDPFG